jgi:hypothetical protein
MTFSDTCLMPCNRCRQTFDVERFLYYNNNINVTLRRNFVHSPQFQPGETLRKRGKLTFLQQGRIGTSYEQLWMEKTQ